MLDLQFICDNQDAVEQNCQARGITADVSAVVSLREQRNALIAATEEARRRQKEVSSKIPKASSEERPALIEQGRELRSEIAASDEKLKGVESRMGPDVPPDLGHGIALAK